MEKFNLKQISSIEKVLLTDKLDDKKEFNSFSALWGEKFSYQIMYKSNDADKQHGEFSFESPIKKYIKVYYVHNVPCGRVAHPTQTDDDYISHAPGLYPDALIPIEEGELIFPSEAQSLWVQIDVSKKIKAGIYPITFNLSYHGEAHSVTFNLEVIPCELPEQKTIFTQWFHGDCIADFHKVKVFSQKHWKLLENYIKTAVECGINMILTPVITPPLDVAIGGERTTIQLVDVFCDNGKYSFDFTKLGKWVKLCKKCGIKYFEMSHMFSQWGAKCSPKIMATVDGEYKRIFGWDIASDSKEYEEFLDAFLPELSAYIEELGIKDITYFHTSDEPNEDHIEGYKKASSLLRKHIKGYKFMDAASHFEYRNLMDIPVVCVNDMQKFIDNKVSHAWVYTCCCPPDIYANRFIAMPSGRNRIMGTLMYKFKIPGYLHWGYNFYNSQLSKKPINPYTCTDSEYAFPAGDPFSVYPYEDGAIHSIRSRVFYDGLQDIRTLELLEKVMSYDEIVKIIEKYEILTLDNYTKDYDNLLKLKQEIHQIIKEKLV